MVWKSVNMVEQPAFGITDCFLPAQETISMIKVLTHRYAEHVGKGSRHVEEHQPSYGSWNFVQGTHDTACKHTRTQGSKSVPNKLAVVQNTASLVT